MLESNLLENERLRMICTGLSISGLPNASPFRPVPGRNVPYTPPLIGLGYSYKPTKAQDLTKGVTSEESHFHTNCANV